MPRVTYVKKARKDYPAYGIKKGESYYWWSFAWGPTMYSKSHPKRSQLTRSSHLGIAYDIEDRLGGLSPDASVLTEIPEILSDLENARDEAQDALDNMPEQLQESNVLNEYIQAFDDMISELEGIDLVEWEEENPLEVEDDETVDDDTGPVDSNGKTEEEYYQEIVDKASEVSFNA